MSDRDEGTRDGDRRSGSSPQKGSEDRRGQGGDEGRERETDSGARRDQRSRSAARGREADVRQRRSRSPLRENDRRGQRSGNAGRSNSRRRSKSRHGSSPRRRSRSRSRSQDAQPSEPKDPIAAIRESLGGEAKLSSFLAEEPKTIRDYMDSTTNVRRLTETVVEKIVPKPAGGNPPEADVPVVYETLVPMMTGTNPSLSGSRGSMSMEAVMARRRISKWDDSSGGGSKGGGSKGPGLGGGGAAQAQVWELAQKLAAEQEEKRKASEVHCDYYTGTFTHPQFGEEPLDIEVTFDTLSSGSWTAVFQTTEIKIHRNGKNIIMSETSGDPAGDTKLEGEFDDNGEIFGDTFQGPDGGGQFVLYPRPTGRVLAAADSGGVLPASIAAFETLKPLKNPTGVGGNALFDITSSLSGPAPAQYGPPKHTMVIAEEALSGLLAKNAESVRHIESSTGAIIKLGRTEKHGNLCRVYGELECAQLAADLMNARVTHITNPSSSSDVDWLRTQSGNESSNDARAEVIEYENMHIGRTLGKDVPLLAQVIADMGAVMQYNQQEPGPDGPEKVRIVGKKDQVALAKRAVQKRLEQALTIKLGAEPSFSPEAYTEIRVEQQFAAWIFGGKNRAHMTQIADRSGASILVMHGTLLEDGCSVIKISGPQGAHDAALVRVNMRIDQSKEYQEKRKLQCMVGDWVCPQCGDQNFRRNDVCRHCNFPRPAQPAEAAGEGGKGKGQHKAGFLKADGDDAFQIEQRCVGYLIGPGGATLKEIKDLSGAHVFIDQETREQGFSIVRIGHKNSPEAIVARELVEKKIAEALSRFAKNSRGPTQPFEKNRGLATPLLPAVPPIDLQAFAASIFGIGSAPFQGNPMHYTQNAAPAVDGPDYSDFMAGMDSTLFPPPADFTEDIQKKDSKPTVYPGCFAVKHVEHKGADKGCSKGSNDQPDLHPGGFADQHKGSEKGGSKDIGQDIGGADFGQGKGKDKSWSDGVHIWSAPGCFADQHKGSEKSGSWDPWANLPGGGENDSGKGKGKAKSWSDNAWAAAGEWSKGASAPWDSWSKGSW